MELALPFHSNMSLHSTAHKKNKSNKLSTKNLCDAITVQETMYNDGRESFGVSKYSKSLRSKYRGSLNRYSNNSIAGLYGIVLPSGMGKTTCCKNYGFIDCDDVLSGVDDEHLMDIRRTTLNEIKPNWKYHNDVWYEKVRIMLRRLTFETSVVLLCHTEEFCLEIGARPICAISTDLDFGLHIENGRDSNDYRFGMLNRRLVRDHTVVTKLHMVTSHQEAEAIVVGYAMQYMAIPNPYRVAEFNLKPAGYNSAPNWILKGEYENHSLSEIEKMFHADVIPACVLQKSMHDAYGIISDVGVFNGYTKWLMVLHEIDASMGLVKQYCIPDSFPHRSKLEADRVGIKMTDVIDKFGLSNDPEVSNILSHHVGCSHTLVTAILVYYATTVRRFRPELKMAVIKSRLLLIPEQHFSRVNKEAYTYVRVAKEFFGMKLSGKEQRDLMYIHTLVGRKLYKVDPTPEILDRTRLRKPYVAYDGFGWSSCEYKRQRTIAIQWLYRRASGVKLKQFDRFIDFWVKRSEFVAKGSTVISDEFEKKYSISIMMNGIVHEVQRRHNKKSLFEQEGIYDLVAKLIIDKWGTNRSKAVAKMNEIGAERALFPGELIQYIVMSCAYFSFADMFPIGSTNLFTITQEHIHKYDMRMRETVEGMLGDGNWHKEAFFCFDFKNFNALHTVEDMIEITNGIMKHAPTKGDFLRLCFRWVEDSYKNMAIVVGDVEHKVDVGLFSGWIFTMVMNCMCNDVYHSIANLTSLNLFGRTLLIYREGLGDDGASRVKYMEDGCLMYEVLTTIGYEANSIKQLIGNTMEFLRVMYSSAKDFGSCICRIISTFVSGNLEHEPISIKELVKTKYEVIELMYNRGMDKNDCNILWACCMARWCRIKSPVGWKNIHGSVLHAVPESGGFGIPDDDGFIYVLETKIPDKKTDVVVVVPGMMAAMDRVEQVASQLRSMGIEYTPSMLDVQRIAEDSYDTKQLIDHLLADSEDEHVWTIEHKIAEKISTVVGSIDLSLVLDFLLWMEKEDMACKQMASYEQYRIYHGVDLDALATVFGNYDFLEAAKFKPAIIHYPRVPEYLKMHFSDFVRCKILRKYIDVGGATIMFANLCATMNVVLGS